MNMKHGGVGTMSQTREEVRVKCEHETWRSGNYESDQRGSEGEV